MISHSAFRWSKSAYALLLLCVAAAIALPAQTFTTLMNFDVTNGAYPSYMSLIQGTDGNFYGTTAGAGQVKDASTLTPSAAARSFGSPRMAR